MRVLVIDDDPSPRDLIERLIRRAGHRVTAVGTDFAAVRAMATERFDVAIVDMEMPGKDGPAMIEALREYDPDLRILVVSGYDDRRRVLAALDAGADGYLVKDEVVEALSSALQSVRAGHTPLSPRVATIMLRQLRKAAQRPSSNGAEIAKIRAPRWAP